jgi:hypothetical protein
MEEDGGRRRFIPGGAWGGFPPQRR